eukprot:8491047-Karenia_brevis.AAC.1
MFDRASLDYIAIQEGRLPHTGVREAAHYQMNMAAADENGNGGVQIWVHQRKRHTVRDVVPVSPWLMYMSVRDDEHFVLVCAHAPHETAPVDRKDSFWHLLDTTIAKIRRQYKGATLVLAIDANAKLGSRVSAHVGDIEAVNENDNGERFHNTLTAATLAAVNTFHSAGHTWTGSRGH